MQIFITRGEDSSGPYTLEQVQDYLSQGVLLADDFAYHEGLEGWIPLEQLIAKSVPLEEPPHPAQMAEGAPPSKSEPVLAEVVRPPVKGKIKTKLIIGAVAGLLVISGLSAGAWFLLKDDPVEQVQTQKPGKLPPTTGTTEPIPSLPPPPTTNPTNPAPTAPTNGTLADALTSKRIVISIEGDEFWVQLNEKGATLDHLGLKGSFKIEGMSLVIQDDDGITNIEFAAANPKEGDAVTVTGTEEPGSSPILGPIKAKLVTLTASEGSAVTLPIPPLPNGANPPEPNPTKPEAPRATPSLPSQPNNSKQ